MIYCIGLNHTTAPVGLREKLAFDEAAARLALSQAACGCGGAALHELVILSTCNRTELYSASMQSLFAELEAFLSATRQVDPGEIRPHLYRLDGEAAIRHLFRVAAGLDSLVLGEPQILGQVTQALEIARGQGAAGPLLNRLFQAAIHAGKRARSETAISRSSASISSLAAALAEQVMPDLAQAQVTILGAGEMAELAVEALRKRGAADVLVVNRSLERAEALAGLWGARAATYETLFEALLQADIVVSSTGAPHVVVSAALLARLMEQRAARPLVMIDIAVPRDIDPAARRLPGLRLYDIDDLNACLERSLAQRMEQTPLVEAILAEEMSLFDEYLRSLEMLPLIADLRQQAEAIRQAELQKTLNRLPDLTYSERQRIEALTQALVKKILETPTRRLRAEADCPHGPQYAEVARTLFNLPGGGGGCRFSGGACHLSAEN